MSKVHLRRISITVCISVLLVGLFGLVTLTTAEEAEPPVAVSNVEPSASSAVLENPTFDNRDWYEFNDRYGNWLTGSWLPDADNDSVPESERQDWRLWFKNGTDLLETDPETVLVDSYEAVQIRAYGDISFEDWNVGHHLGGIYQVIHDTVPCLEYEFSMLGQARYDPPHDKKLDTPPDVHELKVGIDRSGWYLTPGDPAVHGDFPSSTKWGTSQIPYETYGELSVTAEAWGKTIAVFTYADADGGRATRVLWETGSFSEVTPDQIYDPETYSADFGIDDSGVTKPGEGEVSITWTTNQEAISQVYYRRLSGGATVSPTVMSYTVYLPIVANGPEWRATVLNKSVQTDHEVTLSGLVDGDYEYIVVSKGTDGSSACQTWVEKGTFELP